MKAHPIFKREPTDREVLNALACPPDIYHNPHPYNVDFPPDEKSISLSRPQDDCDGDENQALEVILGFDQDIVITYLEQFGCGCFRHIQEGTRSARTGNALRLAWYAMYLHNKNMERTVSTKFKKPADLTTLLRILETCWMPEPLTKGIVEKTQRCGHDHSEGDTSQFISVSIATQAVRNGDVYIETHNPKNALRYLHYRSEDAGGQYPLVYNALKILVLAMHLDETLGSPRGHWV